MVDGGPKRGFRVGDEILNDLLLTDELRDATEYNNIVIGRRSDSHSGFISGILTLANGFKCTLEVESCSEDESNRKFISLDMYQTGVSSMGIQPVGRLGAIEKYKFTFNVGSLRFGSCTVTK
jgi:hypothetical protein